MTPKLLLSAALALAVAGPVQATTISDIFTSFYVLGDSNSDPGNFGAGGPPPPYLDGRFSNGPAWAEYLQSQFFTGDPNDIRTRNYAFGGARVTDSSSSPDLPLQLSVFSADLDPGTPDPVPGTPVLGDRPLVAVWFGANDIRSIFQTYLTAVDAASPLDAAAQQYAVDQAAEDARDAAVQVGATYGATLEFISQTPGFNDLLAFTSADAGLTPEYGDPIDDALLTELSVLFNAELTGSLSTIEAMGNSVYTVDVFAIQQQLAVDAASFGFDNITDPCFDGVSVCATPDTYLAWDQIGHLSGAAHQVLAGIAEDTVLAAQPAPVPLPASLPALAMGIALLGSFWGRRKRA